ncbi:unnamed protein product [Nyctereutes procyonoides]|uniref:(raccoon dog) hypothetical protein n=1 Tax=Nyctereutes procyonoides TaxID=34880 RepID=A0A811YWB0_NYCPR|nr:unnamed protein product [Nyctereutes procyonoides]
MGGQLSASGSFQSLPCTTNADWMSALCPLLWDVPLHHLSIPGAERHGAAGHGGAVPGPADRAHARHAHGDLRVAGEPPPGGRHPGVQELRGHDGGPEVPTLRQLWARGQQVIVSYEEASVVSRHAELWPGIPYWWGDQVKAQELIRYLERMKSCGRPGGLFVAGINLTENLAYVLGHPCESLRKMTLPRLPCLRAWVREQCPGPGARCTNVIAGDFVGADSFVGDVVGLNAKLLRR